MIKKLFTLTLGLMLTIGAMAQPIGFGNHNSKNQIHNVAPISQDSVRYWVGQGNNNAVILITWFEEDNNDNITKYGFVWGIHFNGTVTAADIMDTLNTYDSRINISMNNSRSFINDMSYDDGTLDIEGLGYGWMYEVNGSMANAINAQNISNNNFIEWFEWDGSSFSAPTSIDVLTFVEDPNGSTDTPIEATIAASEILYWVGTGSNEAILAVNWADTCLAWGYRFNGTKTVANMMDDIAAADPRFSYSGTGFLNDITFYDGVHSFAGVPGNYWGSTNNSVMDAGLGQTLNNGDFEKWGDPAAGTVVDSNNYGGDTWYYTYVYTMTVNPVSVPTTTPDVPEDASIAATDILYWVGTGSNEVVLAINWADTALAWGYRFNGEKSVADMMSDIAAADPRFSFTTSGSMLSDINFNTGSSTLGIAAGNYWWSLLNHESGMGMIDDLEDGDFFKWGDLSVAVIADSTWVPDWGGYWDYTYVWPYTIHPVSVPSTTPEVLEDASIEASAIEYWVGNGNNKVILAVNWADTVLAWGYRFNGEKTVADMMTDIASADPRFSYTTSGSMLSDINFTAGNRTFGIAAGNYWWSLLNHESGMGMIDDLEDGDFFKWGDLSLAVIADSTWVEDWGGYWDYAYVWPYTIHAVSQPDGMGPFCNKVGTEGCTAVKFDDSRIKAWATACTVVRGSQNLTNPNAPLVTYGTEDEAVGAASASTMDVVSLGDGGTATLTFANPITNGEGYDFAVFENSFDDYFLELAFVEVSSDGQRFVRFPATSLSQTARQIVSKVDPTYINNLAGKYKVGYGTPFDLDELRDSTGIDINNITHIRIVDVIGSIDPQYATYDAFGHIVNDPFPTISHSAGFDLDGIAVMNQKSEGIDETENTSVSIYPNPVSDMMNITVNEEMTAQLYDMSGRCLMSIKLQNGANSITLDGISNGVYLLRTPAGVHKVVKK